MGTLNRADGYTLIEVLIAVTVFAVLAASAYVALDGMSRAAMDHRQRSADLAELQLAVARIDADLRQITSRAVRNADGQQQAALIGQSRQLTATRSGWANPAGLRRGHLQRFSWQLENQQLVRSHWPVTDLAATTPMLRDAALTGVRDLSIRYRDISGRWHEQWPIAGLPPEALPVAIEVRLDTEVFGIIERLLVLGP
jgi:general secretion pathway protein J